MLTTTHYAKLLINLNPVHCPICGQRLPFLRMPRSWKELLWGGWTCRKCGFEMDKWGRLA